MTTSAPQRLLRRPLSLADKISLIIVLVGIFCVLLVYSISESYRNFAYEHHIQSIEQLAYLEMDDLLGELQTNSIDLALAITKEANFKQAFRQRNTAELQRQLDNQFYQYFVTADILDLLKLYVLDRDFTLLSQSREGIDTHDDSELICPRLSQRALQRSGPQMLQTLSQSCLYNNTPVFAVIVPFGGLQPKAYIQIITSYAYNLQKIEQTLAMPAQIVLLDGEIAYQSPDWQLRRQDSNRLLIELPVSSHRGQPMLTLNLQSDMTAFNYDVKQHRNRVMSIAVFTTVLMVIVVILLLRRTAVLPQTRIHEILTKINAGFQDHQIDNHLLLQQLLEQLLQQASGNKALCLMLIELSGLQSIAEKYGNDVAGRLLEKIRQQLAQIVDDYHEDIRQKSEPDSLPELDSEAMYPVGLLRARQERFALLLPAVNNTDMASEVAGKLIKVLQRSYRVDGLKLQLDCHIGISLYPEHGEHAASLLRNAGKALQQAISLQRKVFVFTPAMQTPAASG